MRANSVIARRPTTRLHPADCTKVRRDGLAWIASANPDWRTASGAPNAEAMGPDLGMARNSIARIMQDPDWPPVNKNLVALAKGGAAAHGVPYLVAYHRIFRDPTVPQSRDNWFAKARTPRELVEAFVLHFATATVQIAERVEAA